MNTSEKQPETANKMGTMPVPKLLLNMGIPMILSMMLQAVYNIVDSAFVSNLPEKGENALNALTLAFPVQMLMVAVGIGTGVGANAVVAMRLGQGNDKRAAKTAGNSLFLAGLIYLVFLLFGLFGAGLYVNSQTSNPQIQEMTLSYLQICCCLSMGIVFFSIFEKLLQATGHSLHSTIAQVAGAVTNMLLDPILIYGLLGFPKMEIKGAALATVIGQLVSLLLAALFHVRYNRQLLGDFSCLKPSGEVIKEIYAIGLPAIIAQALMSFMTYGLNVILGKIHESAVTAYGLYYKIQQFILFAAFGLRDAITPVISFNYGMRDKKRVQDGIRWGTLFTLLIMAVGTLFLELSAVPLSRVFGLSGQTQTLCVSATRIISLSLVFAGANIAFQGIFQALDCGFASLVLSLCRQFLFVLPVAWGFSLCIGRNLDNIWLVWLTFPLAEILTAAIGLGFLKAVRRKKLSSLTP